MAAFYTYIYLIDGIERYVGKGKHKVSAYGERCLDHITKTPKSYWERYLAKCLAAGANLEIHTQDHPAEADALNDEIRLIALYGRRDLKTGSLFNKTDGGEGVSGFKHSDLGKQKMSAWVRSPDLCARMAASRTGLKASPEACEKRRQSQLKPENQAAQSARAKARWAAFRAAKEVAL